MNKDTIIAELSIRAARAELERDAAIKRGDKCLETFMACYQKDEQKMLELLHVCGMPLKELKDIYDIVTEWRQHSR